MFKVIHNYPNPWPEDKPLRVEGQFAREITVSPDLARRRANAYLAGYITMMISGGEPTLVLGEKPVWQVPAVLTVPTLGQVSVMGTIDVDAQTGEVIALSEAQIGRMQEIANALANHFTSPAEASS